MSNAFDRLAAAEDQFFSSEFFSPVLKGVPIRVRIAGVVVEFRITYPKNYQGWGVFKPSSYKTARLVREANMAERNQYLRLFPGIRLVLCRRADERWYGIPANAADTRFKITGFVPVTFAEEVQMFEVVKCRFDGQTFWFQSIDENWNPKIAPYLREQLQKFEEPEKIDCPGMSVAEREAYNLAFWPAFEADVESKKDRQEERIKLALKRAGADYRSYVERGATYTVEYTVKDRHGRLHSHKSVVDKDTLGVQSAGICLAGHDRDFDLQSLISVIVEGHNRGHVVNTEGRMYNEYGYREPRPHDPRWDGPRGDDDFDEDW